MTTATYQHRYVCYARAHDTAPDAMLAQDVDRWPGGCMAGFVLWIHGRWAEFRTLRPALFATGRASAEGHAAFDAWLDERVASAGQQTDLFSTPAPRRAEGA